MLKQYVRFQNWLRREEGQGMVEYGLIIGLVAIGLIAVLGLMKGSLSDIFTRIKTDLGTAVTQ